MKRYPKLLEAVGLAIALFAWAMDWWAVQDAERARLSLRQGIVELQAADVLNQTNAKIRMEGAFTRAALIGRAEGDALQDQYRLFWRNPETRLIWVESTLWTLTYFQRLHEGLASHRARFDIPTSDRSTALRREFDTFSAEYRKRYGDPATGSIPGEAPALLVTPTQELGRVGRFVDHMHAKLAEEINDVNASMDARAEWRSLLYRVLFAIGALLAVSAKALDWFYERRANA